MRSVGVNRSPGGSGTVVEGTPGVSGGARAAPAIPILAPGGYGATLGATRKIDGAAEGGESSPASCAEFRGSWPMRRSPECLHL
jgi:hypothetical protein